jgi:hypothetical protein
MKLNGMPGGNAWPVALGHNSKHITPRATLSAVHQKRILMKGGR